LSWGELLIFAVATSLAGGLGSVVRLFLSRWDSTLPWGILLANSAASFFGAYFSLTASPLFASIMVSGVMGGLSTFSSWAAATGEFWKRKQRGRAFGNGLLNLVIPMLSAMLGVTVVALLVN
jgi:fluoride ion exporter CrcB/FEX